MIEILEKKLHSCVDILFDGDGLDNILLEQNLDWSFDEPNGPYSKVYIFENKNWGTDTVFKDTIEDLKENVVVLLSEKNDIDIYDDIKNMEVFNQFLIKK